MKQVKLLTFLFLAALTFINCSSNDENNDPVTSEYKIYEGTLDKETYQLKSGGYQFIEMNNPNNEFYVTLKPFEATSLEDKPSNVEECEGALEFILKAENLEGTFENVEVVQKISCVNNERDVYNTATLIFISTITITKNNDIYTITIEGYNPGEESRKIIGEYNGKLFKQKADVG